MKRIITISIATVMIGLVGCSSDESTSANNSANNPLSVGQSEGLSASSPLASSMHSEGSGNSGLPGKGTFLRLFGTGLAYGGLVPDIDGDGIDDSALCFDIDLFDAGGRKIGTATDCLSNITPVGDGLALVGTTIFNLPNGTFMTRGHTTVQPITTLVPTPSTHTTGAIPMDGANGVLSGTGVYKNFQANARLSGAVNLSQLDSDGLITFDCLFAIMPLPSE